jgi:hypothetical protein
MTGETERFNATRAYCIRIPQKEVFFNFFPCLSPEIERFNATRAYFIRIPQKEIFFHFSPCLSPSKIIQKVNSKTGFETTTSARGRLATTYTFPQRSTRYTIECSGTGTTKF